MYCDASKEGGLAYLLLQVREDGSKALIQCGSTSLTEAQSRYSITEIELLAVVWGMQKAAFYTKGAPPVVVYSVHSTLTSLHTKELIKIDDQRIVNILERLADYNYSVK